MKSKPQREDQLSVPFEPIKEPWVEYRLEDGAVIRLRFILQQLLQRAVGPTPSPLQISQQVMIMTDAPPSLMGPPGTVPSMQEIDRNITAARVAFAVVSEKPTIYLCASDRLLIVRLRLVTVAKSRLFNSLGQPVYKVSYETAIVGLDIPKTDQLPRISPSQQPIT